ncbi:hypothetical protein, partial [Streptomyces sp. NPDC059168]|uniref:hypothetical protein n=1 Tax=Streptomyces sp. NPDC059168 TaxID=3346753 RepID=UPI00369DAC7F
EPPGATRAGSGGALRRADGPPGGPGGPARSRATAYGCFEVVISPRRSSCEPAIGREPSIGTWAALPRTRHTAE